MKKNRAIRKVVRSKPTIEGAGVHLRRAFGFSERNAFEEYENGTFIKQRST